MTVLSVAIVSNAHQELLYRIVMNTTLFSDNVVCQFSLEHTNSINSLIFGQTWHNIKINVIQTKVLF